MTPRRDRLTAFFDDVQAHVSDVMVLKLILVGVIADEDRGVARRYERDCLESQWEWWWCHDARPWSEGASVYTRYASFTVDIASTFNFRLATLDLSQDLSPEA